MLCISWIFCFFQFVNSTRIHNNIIRVCIANSLWNLCPYIKDRYLFKETRSVTMNIFRKKNIFKSFVKVELSYVFTINMFSTAENCMEK